MQDLKKKMNRADAGGAPKNPGWRRLLPPALALLFLLLVIIALLLRACASGEGGRESSQTETAAENGSSLSSSEPALSSQEESSKGQPETESESISETAAAEVPETESTPETETLTAQTQAPDTPATSAPTSEVAGTGQAETRTETAASTAASTAAAVTQADAESSPAAEPTETGSSGGEAGYQVNAALNSELQRYFYTGNSNNTDPESPYRAMTAEYKETLDALAERWYRGELSDTAVLAAMEQESFRWPDSAIVYDVHFQKGHAQVYELEGHDMQAAYDRVRMGNFSARHYVFLRTEYDASADRCRIWLINGMVW